MIVLPVAYGALTYYSVISTTGTISYGSNGPVNGELEIKAFIDAECTQPFTTINWGTLTAGGSVDRVVFVKNTGTNSVVLDITYDNFSPTSSSGLSLTSDYNGAWNVYPDTVMGIIFTLSVPSTMADMDFSFDLNIKALESPNV